MKTRTDRKPLHSPINFQIAVDNYFEKKFGFKARSSGVFTFPFYLRSVLSYYADHLKNVYGHQAYIVIPKNEYSMVYSTNVPDMYEIFFNEQKLGFEIFQKNLKQSSKAMIWLEWL
jgi:hypothetical protein